MKSKIPPEQMDNDLIFALRMLFQSWYLPADEIPSEFFCFGERSQFTHGWMPGLEINSDFPALCKSQYFWLDPLGMVGKGHAIAYASVCRVGKKKIVYRIHKPDYMPVPWTITRKCPKCGTQPHQARQYKQRNQNCRHCDGLGVKLPEDDGAILL